MSVFDDIQGEAEARRNQSSDHAQDAKDALAQEPIVAINWPEREGKAPPAREFVVEEWLPIGCTTSLYGAGGVGKSLLAQQLGGCVAGGRPFLGLGTMQAPVLGIFCEDDDDELWRRQCRINSSSDLGMRHLRDFHPQGRLGMSNLLMTFPKGRPPEPMPLLAAIEAKAAEISAKLVILDNAAQMFGGEENARAEVTSFINALNGLARRRNAAVLLLGHPPKNGAEYSGSTAWHAAVRCMWTLGPNKEAEEEGDSNREWVVLARPKANYALGGAEVRLRWVDGVLRRDEGEEPMTAMQASYHRHEAKRAFLTALDHLMEQRRNVSHSERASNYAPKLMKTAGFAKQYSKADLKRAMNELFEERAIIAGAELWRGSDRKWVTGMARREVRESTEGSPESPE